MNNVISNSGRAIFMIYYTKLEVNYVCGPVAESEYG